MVIVVPCYKESARLPQFLPGLSAALQGLDCRIQVVDDGSPAQDMEPVRVLVDKLSRQFPGIVLPLIVAPVNAGKGAAIRRGWLAHREEKQLAFVDADGAIAPEEVVRVVKAAMADPKKAFFASRVKMLGRTITRSATRHLYGRLFATVVSLQLNIPVYDSQCGLKVIPAAVFFDNTERFEENRFAFDVELLMILRKVGVEIEEVPIDWTHIEGSKVRLMRDSISMLQAIRRIAQRQALWTSSNKIN